MKRFAAFCLATLALALPSSAQDYCSSLAISSVADDVRPYQTVTIAVEKSIPDAPVFLVVGPTLGKTTISLRGQGSLILDLASPYRTYLFGAADAQGDLSRSVIVPINRGLTLHAQAVSVLMTRNPSGKRMIETCTSNPVTFEL